jgi:hypothetical protein
MASTQSNLVYPEGTWTLLAYDNDDLPGNPTPGEDGSFTWDMQIVAVTPDMASVNGDLVVDGDIIVHGDIIHTNTPTYTDATLQNGWVDYDNTYAPAGYTLDGQGFVHLRGLIKAGASCPSAADPDCILFYLPTGYWPEYRGIFAVFNASGDAVRVDVQGNGQVRILTTVSSTWLSLEGIIFPAFQ